MERILHIIGKMDRAGAETMLMNLYRNINRDKYQFDFVVFTNDKGDYDDEINDRYVVNLFIDDDNKISKINYSEIEYSGYQGFYKETITNNDYNTIKNEIQLLKLERDVINGDTLLTKYNNNYILLFQEYQPKNSPYFGCQTS